MPFAAAVSEHPLATHAVGEVVGQVLERLGDRPDAALLFVTGPFAGAMEDIAATVRATLQPGALVGATASGVIGGAQEVEQRAAISLFAVRDASPAPSGARSVLVQRLGEGWEVALGDDIVGAQGTLVVLADPFSFPIDAFIDEVASRAPQMTVVGGLASLGGGPGANRLVADARVTDHGAVALVLPPSIAATVLVSQGAQPVGTPLVVTRAEGSLVEEIAGTAALDLLLSQAEAASAEDRSRMAHHLHLGVVVDEHQPDFERGDFLIHPVLGADRTRRSIAVGTEISVGTTIQFQVRDAASADEDLRDLLVDAPGTAALVFAGADRGTHLFGVPDHDASIVYEHVEGGATAGMASAGEIGPVGGRAYVHTMTASVLLLSD